VLFSLIVSIPIIVVLMALLLKVVFMSYAGNFPLVIPATRYVVLIVVGMIAYTLIAFLHIRRIKRVPLSLAMKVQE
jgi:putative ABC transport system permease protein